MNNDEKQEEGTSPMAQPDPFDNTPDLTPELMREYTTLVMKGCQISDYSDKEKSVLDTFYHTFLTFDPTYFPSLDPTSSVPSEFKVLADAMLDLAQFMGTEKETHARKEFEDAFHVWIERTALSMSSSDCIPPEFTTALVHFHDLLNATGIDDKKNARIAVDTATQALGKYVFEHRLDKNDLVSSTREGLWFFKFFEVEIRDLKGGHMYGFGGDSVPYGQLCDMVSATLLR